MPQRLPLQPTPDTQKQRKPTPDTHREAAEVRV
eukprot:CAMPEP_0206532482 /NCGR_PEP_ID=MMETSP0325_2-20121206/4404_1 /ASSEMBLY_ACC=CAM_ASM_000347 /TAXON_ID=2866 /ORGANISM="Crypthecodinium cohnii, Strain Seligo" /LENGTH=32 /DNA_ID= /DNA_START= /DNA_END= /DNA_ORIENTATION=